MNNYFTSLKLAMALKVRGIAVCGTMKLNRRDLSKLLVDMKQEFARDIPCGVLTAVV